jgi:hypothetical protein
MSEVIVLKEIQNGWLVEVGKESFFFKTYDEAVRHLNALKAGQKEQHDGIRIINEA